MFVVVSLLGALECYFVVVNPYPCPSFLASRASLCVDSKMDKNATTRRCEPAHVLREGQPDAVVGPIQPQAGLRAATRGGVGRAG